MSKKKYFCPVCDELAFVEKGRYEICTNCMWEDDGTTDEISVGPFSPNHMSVADYRINFEKEQEEKRFEAELIKSEDDCWHLEQQFEMDYERHIRNLHKIKLAKGKSKDSKRFTKLHLLKGGESK